MKVTSVSYKQKFPTGSFLNCDIGFEASIGENENPGEALSTLQKLAESFHKSSFSHLYTESGKPITYSPGLNVDAVAPYPFIHKSNLDDEKPELTPEDGLIEIINQCRTIQLLERQRKQVERMNSPLVTERFNNKMKNLKGEHN